MLSGAVPPQLHSSVLEDNPFSLVTPFPSWPDGGGLICKNYSEFCALCLSLWHWCGDHMEGSRSVQMMCSHPQLSSIKAVFAHFNLYWCWKIPYTGHVWCKPGFPRPPLSIYCRIKPWLSRWHHQLIWLYAGEDSPPRGNSPGQISSHCVVQSAVSGP